MADEQMHIARQHMIRHTLLAYKKRRQYSSFNQLSQRYPHLRTATTPTPDRRLHRFRHQTHSLVTAHQQPAMILLLISQRLSLHIRSRKHTFWPIIIVASTLAMMRHQTTTDPQRAQNTFGARHTSPRSILHNTLSILKLQR